MGSMSHFPLGSAPKVITRGRTHSQAQHRSLPGSSRELPPDVTPCRLQTRGAGQVAAAQILCVWHRVNPAFLLLGEELFLAAEREAWPGARVAVPSCSGCSISSWLGAREVADVLTLGLGAFKGCSSSSSPDLLQVSPDGLSVWIKHAKCCKYN